MTTPNAVSAPAPMSREAIAGVALSKTDVIAAIATASGRSGIGIVRLSGPDLSPWVGGVLGRQAIEAGRALRSRFLAGDGDTLDDGIALYFAAPHSYTGENVLELQGHGGLAVQGAVLRRCLELGARLAEPGEFTRRAFLNDKLDLAQAEAVADLIDADTSSAARAAMRSLSGEFSNEVHAIVEALTQLRMFTEATLDFPEEDVEFLEAERAGAKLDALGVRLDTLLQRARQGQLLREGLQVVLIGRPNVGKSSLLNRLARDDIAIVTPIAGTTRDAVRQRIEIGGVALHVIDTAGVRDEGQADEVERIGIARTWAAARSADCALVVVDDTRGMTDEDRAISARLPAAIRRIVVHNKTDLSGAAARLERDGGEARVYVSAKSGAGIALLETAILDAAGWQPAAPAQFLARERHVVALRSAAMHVATAAPHLSQRPAALELVAEELRLAQNVLASITGEFSADDLLGEIFSRFCIGK
ncbi:MAG: tRNA uridine-5-carboxymethylaminomethyl(34) synthesis GTPase MnmE [Betaproteobacteria bacterium]